MSNSDTTCPRCWGRKTVPAACPDPTPYGLNKSCLVNHTAPCPVCRGAGRVSATPETCGRIYERNALYNAELIGGVSCCLSCKRPVADHSHHPATPTIKMGEQTWYKDGHHPDPAESPKDILATPDCTCNAPSGNNAWHHEWNCARLNATPAPDTAYTVEDVKANESVGWFVEDGLVKQHINLARGEVRVVGKLAAPDTQPDSRCETCNCHNPVMSGAGCMHCADTQSSTDKPETYPTDTQPGDELEAWFDSLPIDDREYNTTELLRELKALIARERQTAHEAAYTQGRIDEAKTCAEAGRHDTKRAYTQGRRELLETIVDKMNEGLKSGSKPNVAEFILTEYAALQEKPKD